MFCVVLLIYFNMLVLLLQNYNVCGCVCVVSFEYSKIHFYLFIYHRYVLLLFYQILLLLFSKLYICVMMKMFLTFMTKILFLFSLLFLCESRDLIMKKWFSFTKILSILPILFILRNNVLRNY